MSVFEVPTYVTTVPLPAPITSGSGVQSYTDPLGDVWIAANGVNGGNWRRARDVLHASVARATAYTTSTSYTAFPWASASFDDYGMWNGTTTFTTPIAGLYLLHARVQIAFGSSGQWAGIYIAGGSINGNIAGFQAHSSGTTAISVIGTETLKLPAGATPVVYLSTSAAASIATNSLSNRYMISYLGTG